MDRLIRRVFYFITQTKIQIFYRINLKNDPEMNLTRIRRLKIDHTWNGAFLGEKEAVDLEIETRSGTGLVVKVSAPFYDDVPPPPGPSGWPFNSLSSYEFTSLFLVGGNNVEALEIQLGP
jgi:sporulation protein YlmC with PRC-barrel domain